MKNKVVFTIAIVLLISLGCNFLTQVPDEIAPTQTQENSLSAIESTPIETQAPTPNSISITEITDDYGVPMMLVPEGEFTMGVDGDKALAECQKYRDNCERSWFTSQEPSHQVYLDAFYMDKYEVTNAFYKACVSSGACQPPGSFHTGAHPNYYESAEFNDYPVLWVDWNQARTYCEWRNADLPTEAQWEKAARGADGRTYPWGENIAEGFANFNFLHLQNGEGLKDGNTTMVGAFEIDISPYGLFDMAGNVSEWVADWYSDTYYQNSPLSNPQGPDSGSSRAVKGGNWAHVENAVTAYFRRYSPPDGQGSDRGFRCARTP